MVKKKLNALYNPELYHGWTKDKEFYESWYLKAVNELEDCSFGFIFGIAMDTEGKKQAFIQVFEGQTDTSKYHTFPAEKFQPKKEEFFIAIDESSISANHLKIDLPDIKGHLTFSNYKAWPKKWYSPGTMGPFAFVPKLECYHQVISMGHELTGKLEYEGKSIDFAQGRGYLLKDWGKSFPKSYVWLQSNHFSQKGVSFEISIARIPWMKKEFTGFIAAFRDKDRFIRFSTYGLSRIKKLNVTFDKVEIVVASKKYKMEISAKRSAGVELASPHGGYMSGRRSETMIARIYVKITDRRTKEVIFEDFGENGGLDVTGNVNDLLIDSKK